MKRALLLAFALTGCAIPGASLDEDEAVETQAEALTAAKAGVLTKEMVKWIDPALLTRLGLPEWANACGFDAPIPTRYVTRMPTGGAIWGTGGAWIAQPVAGGASELYEVSWRPFKLPFVYGGKPPKPAEPDYAALAAHADAYPMSHMPQQHVIAICGASSAASSSSFTARSMLRSTNVGLVLTDMAGCGACAFASGNDIYATLPIDWASDDVQFIVGGRYVEVAAGGSQLLVVPGAGRGATGRIHVQRVP